MELNIHRAYNQVKFFGVDDDNRPIIVSIYEDGRTEVTYFKELTYYVE